MKHIKEIIHTTKWLLWRDLSILYNNFFNSLIDSLMIPCTFILIGGYIMPALGLPQDYGAFMVVGACMMMAFATCTWLGAGPWIADLESDKTITYELTLPIPSWMVIVKKALGFAAYATILNILTIPIGKLLLGTRFDLSQFSLCKFIISYLSANILFGFFAVMIALWVETSLRFGRFWCRVGSHLLFFSGFQFSWMTFYKVTPFFAYINLLNPLVYAFEATRTAVLGQEGNLNFWICLMMMWVFVFICGRIGYYLLKDRLDCV